jgi:hypothetical protein
MEPATRQLIEALHKGPARFVLVATGGGVSATAALLEVPGGSRTVLEVHVPYHGDALAHFLGYQPETSCSASTGERMAARALERARWLAPGAPVIGAACTASLATDRPKRGEHRFFVSTRSSSLALACSATLHKGARDRDGEEAVVAAVFLNALAQAAGIPERVPVPLLPDETVHVEAGSVKDLLQAVLQSQRAAVCVRIDGRFEADAPRPAVVIPGSFNPVHGGHWGLAAAAARRIGAPAAFELSVLNVDKGLLPAEEIRRRLGAFTWKAPVWLTRAPTFAGKAELFPGAVFVIGSDTAQRIVSPRYYGDSEFAMHEALAKISGHGCRFLVAGRADAQGRFVGVDDLAIPDAMRDLFSGFSESECRFDVSSTQLRMDEEGTAG